MLILNLSSMLNIALCVATAGLAVARLFERLGRPYLLTISGTRTRLLGARVLVWSLVGFTSLVVWTILFAFVPLAIVLAIFFGLEAILLDICAQRVSFRLHPYRPSMARQTARSAGRLYEPPSRIAPG
jgi:hypothetical protein